MKTHRTLVSSALVACALFLGLEARADNMASIAITPATGVVTLTPRWAIGGNLAGFHQKSQNLGLTGSVANNFYSIKGGTIPAGGDILAFNFYVAGSGSATPHADIGSKLTPDSYSALTSADPDVGYGSVNLYLIHHKGTTDYFTAIIPGSATSSAVTDEKPMSGPGGPGTVTGVSGYFGLTFAATNLGYGLNNFYYLRTDPVTGNTKFGTLAPALLGNSADQFDLGTGGHKALTYTGSDVGYGVDKMYYLRLDPVTGFTIFGMLDPALAGVRHTSDIANLGSVYSTMTFVPGDVGFGASNFYATGAVNPTWQSVSFAAIADRAISTGSFTVNPTASSALPIVLTVVAGSTGSATISAPIGGVFTITPTAPGLITLQATQAGAVNPIPYEFNMLRQSFTATGVGFPVITNSPLTAAGSVSAAFNFAVTASNTPTVYTASPLPAGLTIAAATGVISGTPTLVGTTITTLTATNAVGTGSATLTITIAAAGVSPIITSPTTAPGTVGTAFVTYQIVATGIPTSYSASGLPAGLVINLATGAITGTPTVAGTSVATINATNSTGTGSATLTITVAPAAVAPIITSATTAPGTVGASFVTYTIAATGLPTSFGATGLPAGLAINSLTGTITGTPAAAGVFVVALSAINSTGTGLASLTITIVPAPVVVAPPAPFILSATAAPGTVGTVFVTYAIVATDNPNSYSASGLPAGLVVNSLSGRITGTPTTAGVFVAQISATNDNGTGTGTLVITIAPAAVAPIITSATTAPGTVGTVFITYAIVATGLPTSYSAAGLPNGLTISSLTGRITGTPTSAGVSVVTLGATNATGTGNATLTITVAPAAVAPIITSPTSAPGTVGTPFVTYLIAATGLPTSYTAVNLPSGLTLNALTGAINGTPTAAGTTFATLTAVNSTGTSTATLMIVIAPAAVAPIITSPASATGAVGSTFPTYLIAATGLPTSYTATNLPPGLTVNALTGAINGLPTTPGNYLVTLTATNALGTSTATVTFTVGPNLSSRITNFSARAISGPGDQTLIMGFVVAGNGKNLLVRGVGPTLGLFGIANPLADPLLTLFSGNSVLATNDDWSIDSNGVNQSAAIAATALRVGAFTLPAGSKDSALLITLGNGAHTSGLLRPNSTTGVALTEIYDTDTAVGARLINVSARMNVTSGEGALIAGFVISGTVPKTVLIRGVGPTLSLFGVNGVLADPQIAVFSGSTQVGSNDNWEASTSTAAQIAAASAQVGAFALPAGSKDAVLLITLQPGAYTVLVSGVGNTTGIALIEVYDTQ